MKTSNYMILEEIQRFVVKTLATNSAGRNLFLIGGFRYRFLDGSVRRSVDIDYHWEEDLVENKVVAIMNQVFIQARDMLDIFLFQSSFIPESPRRITKKLEHLSIKPESAKQRLEKIEENRIVYVNSLKKIIEEQVESSGAENIRSAGGAPIVFDQVLNILKGLLPN